MYNYCVTATNQASGSVIHSQNKYHISHDARNDERPFDVCCFVHYY